MELTPEERARIEAIRDEIGPAHPYVVDGFRAQIGGKIDVKVERKRIARARDAWASLDPVTQDWLRWTTAERIIELLGQSSNSAVADAVRAMSEDELARLRSEIAIGYQFVEVDDPDEVAEVRPSGQTQSPIDPPALLDASEEAMTLPPYGLEGLPNLRAVVRELYAIWRKDKPGWRRDQPGTPKVGKEAIAAIGEEVAQYYRLPIEQAERRVRVCLRELDARNELPLR